jgi:hypothetical protein
MAVDLPFVICRRYRRAVFFRKGSQKTYSRTVDAGVALVPVWPRIRQPNRAKPIRW